MVWPSVLGPDPKARAARQDQGPEDLRPGLLQVASWKMNWFGGDMGIQTPPRTPRSSEGSEKPGILYFPLAFSFLKYIFRSLEYN